MLGCGSMVRTRMLSRKLNITRHSNDSVATDLDILERTQVSVERNDMHHCLSGSWAHRVENADLIKPLESTLDLGGPKPDFKQHVSCLS